MQRITARAAARMLGVHANTIARYEQRGLLHAVRLPSVIRRFDPAEVMALAESDGARAGDDKSQLRTMLEAADEQSADDRAILGFDSFADQCLWDLPSALRGRVIDSQDELEALAPLLAE